MLEHRPMILPRVHPARTLVMLVALACATNAAAHEFWIEPVDFRPAAGAPVVANLYTGQRLTADPSPWNPGRFERLELVGANGAREVSGTRGALPAVSVPTTDAGLQMLVGTTAVQSVRYPSFDKFEAFATEEGSPELARGHIDAGLPTVNLVELYTRHAKALVRTGDPVPGEDVAGVDIATPVGLELELVPLDDPYANDVVAGTPLRFELLLDGAPLSDHQVALFHRPEPLGEVVRSVARTDASGRVGFPTAGPGTHLLSAVLIRRPSARTMLTSGATWESLWASLTFDPGARSTP